MSEITSADVPGVHGIADRLGSVADRLSRTLTSLQRELDAVHGCWGDDSSGKAFEGNYVAPADQEIADLGLTADTLGAIADNLSLIADAFQQMDAEGGEALLIQDQ